MHTQLQVFRWGKHRGTIRTQPLSHGEKGTVEALEIAAQMVREDALDPALWRLVTSWILSGVSGHEPAQQIDKAFKFARDRITYQLDPRGTERVVDLHTALCTFALQGDCLVKSIFLATTLALLGFQPFFVVIKQTAQSTNYHHVFVGIIYQGSYLALDPTPEDAPAGWEAASYVKSYFPIFD
jgi:hypothetical protein